jgi:tryptophan synthase alpha chain
MSRLEDEFNALRGQRRAALACYITAGDPSAAASVACMHALVRAGANVIELGMPFSDPMADGPVIQRAATRALAAGANLRTVLEIVTAFRRTDVQTPVVLMGYANPIETMGWDAFAQAVADAGGDAVLIVDLPPEESTAFNAGLRRRGLEQIFLVAPTTGVERARLIAGMASGFVYYVALKGTTGAAGLEVQPVRDAVTRLRADTALPILIGFGIQDPDSAAEIAAFGDGVVIGSTLVAALERAGADAEAAAAAAHRCAAGFRAALDRRLH